MKSLILIFCVTFAAARGVVTFENITGNVVTVHYSGDHVLAPAAGVVVTYGDEEFSFTGYSGVSTGYTLDHSVVAIFGDGRYEVRPSAAAFVEIFMRGFFFGLTCEFVGMMLRGLRSMTRTRPE